MGEWGVNIGHRKRGTGESVKRGGKVCISVSACRSIDVGTPVSQRWKGELMMLSCVIH